jgi:5-methylcytosine-specific restriction endonuclease McrA
VLDRDGKPLQPCRPGRARHFLKAGRAVVVRHTPFVIRLTDRTAADSTVAGVERQYLLEKWGRTCAYCGAAGAPLQVEHIHPKARGGSDRISNLTLACRSCNEAKNTTPVEEFLRSRPTLLARILQQAKTSLRDAAAVNATRWALWRALTATTLPVATGSGGRTKWNRSRTNAPKSHTLDALHVGELGQVTGWPGSVLVDTGIHTGRVAVRTTGSFNITTATGTRQGINHKHIRLLQRADGYSYTTRQENTTER